MKLSSLLDVLWASTLTHRVRDNYSDRGGIILVSPPGHLKTTFLSLFSDFAGVLGYSDLTSTSLLESRDAIVSGKVHTLLLYDMQKLYERRADTAANIIGNLRALAGEGFATASFERVSRNVIQQKARALVLGACTHAFYRQHLAEWEETGFSRRFLFSVFRLKDPDVILDRVLKDNPIELIYSQVNIPANLSLDGAITKEDERLIVRALGKQQEAIPALLLRRILLVLRWRSKRLRKPDRSREILRDFAQSLSKEGAMLEVQ
jgi:hypothetical protein